MKQRKQHKNNGGSQGEKAFFKKEVEGKTVKVERRRCTLVNVITGVTGNAASYSVGNNNVTAAFEFSNYALIYQEYRVRAIKTRVVPRVRDNIQTAAGVIYPGSVVSGGFVAGAGAATYAAIFAASGNKVTPEWATAENLVTWKLNPNAHLWTPTSATVATANQFGVQFLSTGTCPAVFNTLTLFDTFTEFDVEFRTAQ